MWPAYSVQLIIKQSYEVQFWIGTFHSSFISKIVELDHKNEIEVPGPLVRCKGSNQQIPGFK